MRSWRFLQLYSSTRLHSSLKYPMLPSARPCERKTRHPVSYTLDRPRPPSPLRKPRHSEPITSNRNSRNGGNDYMHAGHHDDLRPLRHSRAILTHFSSHIEVRLRIRPTTRARTPILSRLCAILPPHRKARMSPRSTRTNASAANPASPCANASVGEDLFAAVRRGQSRRSARTPRVQDAPHAACTLVHRLRLRADKRVARMLAARRGLVVTRLDLR